MCAEYHNTILYTRNNRLSCPVIQEMFDSILISGFYWHSDTDIISIRDLIFCIILKIPEFKFIRLENHCI